MTIVQTNKGFTLIEVVIALGVLGFGILAMFSMQAFGIRGNASASKITHEITWSASGMEKLLMMEYDDVAGKNQFPALDSDFNASLYNTTWNVAPDTPIPGMMTVTVNIQSVQDNKQVTLEYLRVNEAAL